LQKNNIEVNSGLQQTKQSKNQYHKTRTEDVIHEIDNEIEKDSEQKPPLKTLS
jgi:hypothetical protein